MGKFAEIDIEQQEAVCSSCAGSGEVMNLCNPSDPNDGSYHLDGCAMCFGTGVIDAGQFKMHPIVYRRPGRHLQTEAIKSAVVAFNKSIVRKNHV